MKSTEVVEFCRRLRALGIEIWLDGGWGVDALLGEQTRPHEDLDIVVEQRHLEEVVALLRADGFDDVPRPDTRPCNFVLGHTDGRLVDFHVVTFDAAGNGVFEPPHAYPASAFTGGGTIDGLAVNCLAATYQIARSGYTWCASDFADVRALCTRFNLPFPKPS